MKTPDNIETTGYTTRGVSTTDAAAVIADVHAHSRDYQSKAVSEFGEILKTDPANATAARGLGYAYLQKHDFDHAAEYFQRSAKADPKDARVHYYNGLLTNIKGSGNPSDLVFAGDELKSAIALDPDFADAYMQLAYVQRQARDIEGALANAGKAASLNPRNQAYYFNIADLYLQEKQPALALSILRSLTKSSDPMIASRASATVSQVEQMQAEMKRFESERAARADQPQLLVERASAFDSPAAAPIPVDSSPVKFLKGTIVSVDCSSGAAATLRVASSGKNWTMQVHDNHHVLVLGSDGFSCNWSGQKAAVNYRQTGELAGVIVSIEIQ
jgi:Flp pilus assembly protein TadD